MALNKDTLSPIFKNLKLRGDGAPTFESALRSENFTADESVTSTLDLENSQISETQSLTGYSRIQELKLVKIGIASSEQIMSWAEKTLPNGKVFGEVLNANTLHYKTFKPQKGGLFCQRVFGPLKDFECACGIVRKPSSEEGLLGLIQNRKPKRTYCPVCDVEYTWSVIRRYQLGYIKLASPVTHLWYLKANPSYLSMLLDFRKKELEDIIYCTQILTLEDFWRPRESSEIEFNPNFSFEAYKKYLYGPDYDGGLSGIQNTLKQRKEKQKKAQKQKRQNFKVRRQGLSYVYVSPFSQYRNLDEPSVPLLASRSRQDQIESLETAYRLSSSDYRSPKLTRRQNMAKLLMEKKISENKRNLLFDGKNDALKTFYRNYAKDFAKTASLGFQKLFPELHPSSPLFSPPSRNTQLNKALSNFAESSLKKVIKDYLKPKSKGHEKQTTSRKAATLQTSSSASFRFQPETSWQSLRWGVGNNYRYTKNVLQQVNGLKVDSVSSEMTASEFALETEKKNAFLVFFLNLVRKSNPQQNWDSIYSHSKEALQEFENPRKSVGKNFFPQSVVQLFQQTFANSVSLYLLYFLQNPNKQKFLASAFEVETEFLILTLFTNVVSLQTNWLSLQDVLMTDPIFNKSNTLGKFFETNVLSQNSSLKKFQGLTTSSLFNLYTIFLALQSQHSYKEKSFRIFLSKKTEEIGMFEIHQEFNQNHKTTEFGSRANYREVLEKNFKANLEFLLYKKKVSQFLKNIPSYPQDLKSYFRNRFQMRQNLNMFKQRKPLPAFQLFNKLYTVGYSESWQFEKDWKYFLYYSKAATEFNDQVSIFYAARFYGFVNYDVPEFKSGVPIVGAHILQKLLLQYEGIELKKMAKQVQNVLPKLNRAIRYRKQKAFTKLGRLEVQRLLETRDDLIRRLKLLRKLFKKKTKTSSMVLNTVPVLPPDLRPILKMHNQIAASDLNRFYQRILYRNDRLKKFIRANAALMNTEPAFEVKYAQRLLQEAVDNLIQNGKGQVKPETNSRGQPLKSLSEILKGKQGRFRQYLLGKRVDYSGRSVIVVGPALKIYECGLPFEMAIELFLPFLIKRIFQYNLARTVMGAKTILKYDRKTTWHLLEEIMQHHPILLNRAPTLHRLGIQAFQPKLIEGRAILLHPLVCPAFNADFDGDQMAVHVPITVEARTEAWKLMFSRNHLVSPATGDPMLLPTQDMVLGCYYLTTTGTHVPKYNFSYPFTLATSFYFSNMKQILQAYLQEKIQLQTPVWMRWHGLIQFDQSSSQPYELRVRPDGSWIEIQSEYHRTWNPSGEWKNLFVLTTAGRILFNLMVENCVENKP